MQVIGVRIRLWNWLLYLVSDLPDGIVHFHHELFYRAPKIYDLPLQGFTQLRKLASGFFMDLASRKLNVERELIH